MTRRVRLELGVDPFRAAVGLAAVAGLLSLLLAFLSGLAAALTALAVAAWSARRGRAPVSPPLGWAEGVGLGVVAAAAGVFVLASGPLAGVRGAVIGLAALPLYGIPRWPLSRVGSPAP